MENVIYLSISLLDSSPKTCLKEESNFSYFRNEMDGGIWCIGDITFHWLQNSNVIKRPKVRSIN